VSDEYGGAIIGGSNGGAAHRMFFAKYSIT
jgi:hypothetical protein